MKAIAICEDPKTLRQLRASRLFESVMHVKWQRNLMGFKCLPGEQVWVMLYDGLLKSCLDPTILGPVMAGYGVVVHEVSNTYTY